MQANPVQVAGELWNSAQALHVQLVLCQAENQQLKEQVKDQKSLLEDYRNINKQLKEQTSKIRPSLLVPSTETDKRASKSRQDRQESRQDTPGSALSTDKSKRSAKFPDPPVLDDGQDPTFQIWVSQMRNKLSENADWFENEDPDKQEQSRVAYIQTRIKGKAADHLYPWLESKRENLDEVMVEDVIQVLQNVFDDPDKRIKARDSLKQMKMKYAGDFNAFQAEFLRLAVISKLPQSQWKEEFHGKLYAQLRTLMELYVAADDTSFNVYCRTAQQYARGLSAQNKERQEKQDVKKFSDKGKMTKVVTGTRELTTGGSSFKKPYEPSSSVKCFVCQKTGHYSTSCPQNVPGEKRKPAENKVLEEFESASGESEKEDEIATDSENE